MAIPSIPLPAYRRAGRIVILTLLALAFSCDSSARAQTVVSLTFDDGIETQSQVAAPLLAAHGMHGTFYINSDTVASKPYFMTWPQVDDLAAQGNEIGGHTLDHVHLPDLDPTEQQRQICDDAATLRGRGFNVTSFAYPYGAGVSNATIRSIVQSCGYASARRVGSLRSDPSCGTCPYAETYPPTDPYGIRSSAWLDRPITLSDLEGWVTDAEQNGGGWLPLMFHDVCDVCPGGNSASVSPADFGAFLDWLAPRAATGTVVKTMQDALTSAPKPPATTTISCDGHACSSNWQKGPVTVALSATDGGGGLDTTRYTLDGSDPTPSSPQYTGPFTLALTTTVKFRTWDLGGNAEPVRSQQLRLDATPPTGQISSPADGTALAGDITLNVDAADTESGVVDVELFIDGNYRDYSRSKSSPYQFVLPAGSVSPGAHKLKAMVMDAAGNRTWTAQITLTVKSGLPTTTISCDGHACSTDWQKGPVSVSLAATDGGGGLGATRYTLDGSDPSASSPQYSGPFTLTDSATVKFRSFDLAGNPEVVRSQQLKIDGVGPTAQIISPVDGASVAGDLTLKVAATDAGAGVTGVELFVDGDYKTYSRSKTSPYDLILPAGTIALGTHKFKALVSDALGNRTWTVPITLTLKDGLPTTTISCDGLACPAGFVKGPVTVTLAAIDGGGGLGATRYTTDGSDPSAASPAYSGPFVLTGTTTVKFRSFDSAGNAEAVRSQTIKIDSIPPTAQITSPLADATVSGDVTAKIDAADAGSGVASVELFIDGDYVDYSRSKITPYLITWHSGAFAPGLHKLKSVVLDALGNRTTSAIVTVKVADPAAVGPTTTIACNGLACPVGFLKGPVSVTLAAIDGGGGLGATRYTTDGSDPTVTSPAYTGPFTLTTTTTVKFRSWDGAGNAEPVRSQTIKIDSTAPTAQITSPLTGATVSGDVTVTIDAADAGSGVYDVELFVDGNYVDYSRSKSPPYLIIWHAGAFAPGSHKLKALVADAVGNRMYTSIVTVTVAG